MLRHGPRTGVLAASIGAMIASGGVTVPAFGQEEDEAAADSSSDDSIVVTGTRIRRDDFTSTNATVVVTAEDMRNLGVTSVAEMVNQLPSNVASQTPETRTDSNFNMGASIANLRGLNTSSGSRTLVLVDSTRFVSSNSGGSVDMNMIPTALVGRIETVTGGASATYGADAMAGVVNVILDNNIEGIRVDLSYSTTDAGDGDDVNLSIGTGFEVFDRRGQVTVGYDHSVTDPIDNCTTREFCQFSWGLLGNAIGAGTPGAVIPPANILYPNQPQYIITEGMRYTRLPEGIFLGPGLTDPNLGVLPASQVVFATNTATNNNTVGAPARVGSYRFSDDGRTIVPYLDNLDAASRDYINRQGTAGGITPWGSGSPMYLNIPLLPEQTRDNLFTRFTYDFEGGISLNASLTYGETNAISKQNSVRQTALTLGCIFPSNAFLSTQWGASPELREMMADRAQFTMPALATMNSFGGACRPGPYLGQTFEDDELPDAQELFDFPETGGTLGVVKSMHPFINRFNDTDTETLNFSLGATGDLFEGGSWTWDANLNIGGSERLTVVHNQQSARRMEMAVHSLWDPTANGGAGAPVCAIDSNQAYTAPPGNGPAILAAAGYPVPTTMGEYWSYRWIEYIRQSLGSGDPTQALAYFNNLAGREPGTDPCAPFNPFGNQLSDGSLAYTWPSISQGSENNQDSVSLSFSGDIGDGIGAGPFRMAAGVDFRLNESVNYGNPNAYTARDFGINFADNWTGETETQEAFVEFDFPVLRDLPGADYLMFNVAARKTYIDARRLEGAASLVTKETSRDIPSWKVSMVWQPVDLLMVRATRSADTRAPTAQELFQTNRTSLSTGANNEIMTFFRFDDPATAGDERWDFLETYTDGGNSSLEEETAITQTLGLVFTPTELLSGLSVSVDYYETDIKGGIENIGAGTVDDLCGQELLANGFNLSNTVYCPNVVFGSSDPAQNIPLTQAAVDSWNRYAATPLVVGGANPFYNFSDVETLTASARNQAPYFSRGIDISVSYNTQLQGGGFISARVLASRALEQTLNINSGATPLFFNTGGQTTRDVSGQTGSNGLGSVFGFAAPVLLNYSPTPRISGNMFMTYSKNALTMTSQVRYVGSGRLNNQQQWIGPGERGNNPTGGYYYAPGLFGTVTDSTLPSWTTLNLTFEYDFSASSLQIERFESLSAYIDIDNVANRTPDFFSGNGAGGINTTYFSGIGREYRLGVRMQF